MSAELRIVQDDELDTGPMLDQIATQRAALRRAMIDLEDAVAAAAGGRVGAWSDAVEIALRAVGRAWAEHTEITETEDGLLDEILTTAPRLANAVRRLRAEHVEIAATLAGEIEATAAAPRTDGAAWIEERREALTRLLASLARHRQRGADLTYEAYAVELGGQE